jgi:acetyltransferase-like isoleucine patch superfamily enzyme
MSGWDRFFSYFTLVMVIVVVVAFTIFASAPSLWTALLLLGVLYLGPPIILQIVRRWARIEEGIERIDARSFSPWLASHHIQAFYDGLPFLESLLRVIPGSYSMWLRLWGSRVGYGVEWPVNIAVLDRDLMDIGNRVVFSRQVELAAHVRKKTEGGSRVLVRRVRIGSYAFLGAGARIGPGAVIPANAAVPALAHVGVNETFGEGVHQPRDPQESEFVLE